MQLDQMTILHECPLLRAGLHRVVGDYFSCSVVTHGTAAQTLQDIRSRQSDLLICSFMAPKLGALELIKRVKIYSPRTKILVCASQGSLLAVEKSIQNGADGYVTSSIGVEELNRGIEKIMAGHFFTEASVTNELAINKVQGSQHALNALSSREFDIFIKIARDKPVRAVAEELFLAEKTIANYVSIIKKKLKVKTNAGMLEIALREGYIDLAEREATSV